jgi:hypothetical protein
LLLSCALQGNSGRLRIHTTIMSEGSNRGEITCAGIRWPETDKSAIWILTRRRNWWQEGHV